MHWLDQKDKMKGYHLKIETLSTLFVVMPAHYLVINGNVCNETNIIMNHPKWDVNIKKLWSPNYEKEITSNLT